MSSLQMNPCSKPIPIAHSEGPVSEARKVLLTAYIDRCVKNPLGVKVCIGGGGGGGLSRDV